MRGLYAPSRNVHTVIKYYFPSFVLCNIMHLLTVCKVGKSGLCLVEVSCRESELDLSLIVDEVAGGAEEVSGSRFVEKTDSGFDLGSTSSYMLSGICRYLPININRHTMTAQVVALAIISLFRMFSPPLYCSRYHNSVTVGLNRLEHAIRRIRVKITAVPIYIYTSPLSRFLALPFSAHVESMHAV